MTSAHHRPAGAGALAPARRGGKRAARLARATAWLAVSLAPLLALALLALGAAACGRGDGAAAGGPRAGGATAGAASAPLPDACQLMMPADVQAVAPGVSGSLSSTLEDAVGKDPGQCSYSLGGMPPRVVSLALRRLPSAEQAASQLATAESGLRSLGAGATVEEVPGLGDGAFWVGGQIDQLHVRRRDLLLIFTVQVDKEPLRPARTLAAKALSRLDQPAGAAAPAAPGGGPP